MAGCTRHAQPSPRQAVNPVLLYNNQNKECKILFNICLADVATLGSDNCKCQEDYINLKHILQLSIVPLEKMTTTQHCELQIHHYDFIINDGGLGK